jgi:hypothetical protein
MTRHLKECAPKHDPARGKLAHLFHLRVEGAESPIYWLDLEIKSHSLLSDLDEFLRRIWLECCGHLSAFHFGRVSYTIAMEAPFDSWSDERDMDVPVAELFYPIGTRFTYEYDFGSTTSLSLRIQGEREGKGGRSLVRFLARNEPPVWPCAVCKQPATFVCPFCVYDGEPFYCDQHCSQHECYDEEAFLPIVNSPRMGTCGYTGEDY